MVATRSPRPMRAIQRAKLWAMTWTASQAALAEKRPEGRWSWNPLRLPLRFRFVILYAAQVSAKRYDVVGRLDGFTRRQLPVTTNLHRCLHCHQNRQIGLSLLRTPA